jgi:hypothetical protein
MGKSYPFPLYALKKNTDTIQYHSMVGEFGLPELFHFSGIRRHGSLVGILLHDYLWEALPCSICRQISGTSRGKQSHC